MARFQTIRLFTTASLVLSAVLLFGIRDSRESQAGTPQNTPDLVLVRASVTDPLNRYVADLEQKDFKLQEDKSVQNITYFASKSAPISLGIIYENTGKIELIRTAIKQWLQPQSQLDDLFLISFSGWTARVENFTGQGSTVADKPAFAKVAYSTPLEEAVHLGVQRMEKQTSPKKALVVISEATHTLTFFAPWLGKNPAVQVYAIGRTGRLFAGPESVVTTTAGNLYQVDDMVQVDYYLNLIHSELQNQYVLGYVPSNRKHDGNWRKLLIAVNPRSGLAKLTVKAPKGYYAPEK